MADWKPGNMYGGSSGGMYSGASSFTDDTGNTYIGWEADQKRKEEEERKQREKEEKAKQALKNSSFASRTQSEINNSNTRLEAAGTKKKEKTFLQKAFNLDPDQNWFMDTLEVLGRPGQGVKNMLDGAINKSGKSAGKEFMEGLTGKEEVSGTDIVKDLGWTDKSTQHGDDFIGKAGTLGDKFLRGVTGFGVDVVTDPFTFLGGAAAKGVGAAAKGTTKAADAVLSKVGGKSYQAAKQTGQNVGDELGRLFNTKNSRGLDGTKSSFIKDTMTNYRANQTANADQIFNTMNTARQGLGGLGEGAELGKFIEAPLMANGEINPLARNAYDLSTKNKLEGIRSGLQTPLDDMRNQAANYGVDIKDTFGDAYMPRSLTKEAREAGITETTASQFANKINQTKNAQRTTTGAVEDINNAFKEKNGFNLFEDNAVVAFGDKMKQMSNSLNAEALKRDLLSNSNFARELKPGEITTKNDIIVNADDYNFFSGGDGVKGTVKNDLSGKQFVVTKDVKQAMDSVAKRMQPSELNTFLKAFDKISNVWKSTALFSAGFHARNFIGNSFNMYLGKMRPDEIVKFQNAAIKELKTIGAAKKSNSLDKVGAKAVDEYNEFMAQGLTDIGRFTQDFTTKGARESLETLEKRETTSAAKRVAQELKNPAKAAVNGVKGTFDASQRFGSAVDTAQRFAMYKWARAKGMDAKQAASHVREYLFDYSDLGTFETEIAKRVVPFYTFMRKNAALQLSTLAKDPAKLTTTNKLFENALNTYGMDRDSISEFNNDNWNLPVAPNTFLSTNLPVADLGKMGNPTKMFQEGMNPLIKTPLELGTNRNFFTGKEIEEFNGQKKQFNLPFNQSLQLDPQLAHVVGNVGAIQNISRNSGNLNNGDMTQVLSARMLRTEDPEQVSLSKLLSERDKVRGEIKAAEQDAGAKLPTIADLLKAGLIKEEKDKNGKTIYKIMNGQ